MASRVTKYFSSWAQASQAIAMRAVNILASQWVRWLMVVLAILLLAYAVFQQAWRPINLPIELPLGVTPTNPELDSELLKEINRQRAERVGYEARQFDRYNVLFVPPQTSATP